MVSTVVVVIVVVVVALIAIAALRPDTFRVERSTVIAAPPEAVFALLDDFHRWSGWSPWEHKDPDMQRSHSGAERGVGAVYEWRGNRQVGEGRMQITASNAPSTLVVKLDFLKPFEAHNTAEFVLTGEGGSTSVSWANHGPCPFLSKLMGLFVSMDRMIGPDFETGLANLKALAEKG